MTSRQRRYDESISLAPTVRYVGRPELRADVGVPALQAAVVGILGGALAGMVGGALGMPALTVGGPAGVTIALGVFVWQTAWAASTMHAVERILQRDLDGDQVIGEPEPAWRQPVLVNPYTGRRARAEDDHEADRRQFAEFVQIAAADSSARNLEKRFGRARAQSWRDALIGAGWGRWRTASTRDGWTLTGDPERIIAALG